MTPDLLTIILGTLIITVTCSAFWHNQPARQPNDQRRLGGLVNRALEWLVLMPHLSNPAEKKGPALVTGVVRQDRQTASFRPALRPLFWKPGRRILGDRAGTQSSAPTHLFKPQEFTNALATENAA